MAKKPVGRPTGSAKRAAPVRPASKASVPVKPKPTRASIYSNPSILPPPFSDLVNQIEAEIGMPLYLLVQNDAPNAEFSDITFTGYKGFQRLANTIPPDNAALLI